MATGSSKTDLSKFLDLLKDGKTQNARQSSIQTKAREEHENRIKNIEQYKGVVEKCKCQTKPNWLDNIQEYITKAVAITTVLKNLKESKLNKIESQAREALTAHETLWNCENNLKDFWAKCTCTSSQNANGRQSTANNNGSETPHTLSNQIQQLKAENDNLRKQLNEQGNVNDGQVRDSSYTQKLKDENEQLRDEIKQLKEKSGKRENASDTKAFEKKIREKEEEIERLKQRIDTREKASDTKAFDKKVRERDEEIEHLKKRLKAATETIEKMKTDVEDRDRRIQDIQSRNDKSKTVDKLRAEIDTLNRKVQEKDRDIEVLRTRLSSMAAEQLRKNNPDITDLSDAYRPTKLGELFHSVYDDEWTHAFEALDTTKMEESKIIGILARIVEFAKWLCEETKADLLKQLKQHVFEDLAYPRIKNPNGGSALLKKKQGRMKDTEQSTQMVYELAKGNAALAVDAIEAGFTDEYMKHIMQKTQVKNSTALQPFARKVVRYLWFMEVQDPPMHLLWQKTGDKFDKDRFSFYTASGTIVGQCVWPAVLLHKGGPLISKGIAQGKA